MLIRTHRRTLSKYATTSLGPKDWDRRCGLRSKTPSACGADDSATSMQIFVVWPLTDTLTLRLDSAKEGQWVCAGAWPTGHMAGVADGSRQGRKKTTPRGWQMTRAQGVLYQNKFNQSEYIPPIPPSCRKQAALLLLWFQAAAVKLVSGSVVRAAV